MRSLLAIVAIVLVAIGLAVFSSHLHPGGDLPPAEIEAEKDRADAEAQQKLEAQRLASVDHSPQAFDKVKDGAIQATLQFDGKAPMTLELYPKAAPKTVAHIVELIKKGFYNGIKVHRLEDGSQGLKLIQMGDPMSIGKDPSDFQSLQIGTHGSGTTVPLEVLLPHVQYSVGMARGQGDDTGDSQFYINTGANPNLDGHYCIFGRVISGQDVLPTIKKGDVIKKFSIP